MKAYWALIRIEIKLALRNRTALFFNYMFPLIFFFIFAQAFHAEQGGAIIQVVAMVGTIGIIGNGLFGAGMRAVQEREQGILRRYKVTPISPLPLLTASMVTGVVMYLPYIALMLTIANRVYHMPVPERLISVFLFVAFGIIAFRALGLIIASVVNSMQESVVLVQILYFAMMFLSGASFPISIYPSWLQNLTQFIPATYLVSGLQGILLRRESILQNAVPVLAMVVTAAVALFISTKLFRWEKEEKIRNTAKLWVSCAGSIFPDGDLPGIQQRQYRKSEVGQSHGAPEPDASLSERADLRGRWEGDRARCSAGEEREDRGCIRRRWTGCETGEC